MGLRMYRQGDVLLMEEPAGLPPDAMQEEPTGERIVLAYGEVTGHAHALRPDEGVTAYQAGPERFVVITGGKALLRHEEHAFLKVPPGTYRVRRQREYTPESIRTVAD